jgi:hypothetical protein
MQYNKKKYVDLLCQIDGNFRGQKFDSSRLSWIREARPDGRNLSCLENATPC